MKFDFILEFRPGIKNSRDYPLTYRPKDLAGIQDDALNDFIVLSQKIDRPFLDSNLKKFVILYFISRARIGKPPFILER